MDEFTILVLAAIAFASIIMLVLAFAMILFGRLIEDTPDGLERRGERIRDEKSVKSLSSPKNMSRIFALAFSILFVIGSVILILASGSKVVMIIGGVSMFSALLFSATIVALELIMYRTMQANLKDLKGSVVA
jgi:1,4-dihydroxy-2-naphthoate octaprenyltransferase